VPAKGCFADLTVDDNLEMPIQWNNEWDENASMTLPGIGRD